MEQKGENMADQGQPNSIPGPSGIRVLVVDNSPPCRMIIEQILTSCEYLVTTCDSGEAALALLRERRQDFDIVVTDVHMPNMDGLMLLERIRLEMDLPVVLLSADSQPSMILRGLREGAVFYYTKPAKVEELKHIWQHVVWWKGTREVVEAEQSTCLSVNRKENGNSRMEEECTSKMSNEEKMIRKAKRKLMDFREDEGETSRKNKRSRVVWDPELHNKFLKAIKCLGYDRAVPKTIHGIMNVPGLSRENVASHLQKFRLYIKKHEQIGLHKNMQPAHSKDLGRRENNTRHQNNLASLQAYTTTKRRASNSGSGAPSNVTQTSTFLFGSGSNAQTTNQENLVRPPFSGSYLLGSSSNTQMSNQENLVRPVMAGSCLFRSGTNTQIPNQENLVRPVMSSPYLLGSSPNTQIPNQENLVRPAMIGSYSHGSGSNNQMRHQGNRVRPIVSMANGVFTVSNFQGSNNQASMGGNVGSVGRLNSRPRHSIYDVSLSPPRTSGLTSSTQRSCGANSNFSGLLAQMDMQKNSSGVLPQVDVQMNSHGVLPQMDRQMNSHRVLPQMDRQMNSNGPLPQMEMQMNSHGILSQIDMQMNSNRLFPQMDMQMNSNGLFPQMDMQMNSHGVFPQMDMQMNSNGIFPQMDMQMNSNGVLPQMDMQMNPIANIGCSDTGMSSLNLFSGRSQYPNNVNGMFQQDHSLDGGISATQGVVNQPGCSMLFTPTNPRYDTSWMTQENTTGNFSLPPIVHPDTFTAPPIDNQFQNNLTDMVPVDNEVLWGTSSYGVEDLLPKPFPFKSITNEISNLNISDMDQLGSPAGQFDLIDPFPNSFTQILQEDVEPVGGTKIDDFPTETVPSRFSDDDIRVMTDP